jgi:hypothetical protein
MRQKHRRKHHTGTGASQRLLPEALPWQWTCGRRSQVRGNFFQWRLPIQRDTRRINSGLGATDGSKGQRGQRGGPDIVRMAHRQYQLRRFLCRCASLKRAHFNRFHGPLRGYRYRRSGPRQTIREFKLFSQHGGSGRHEKNTNSTVATGAKKSPGRRNLTSHFAKPSHRP